MEQETTIIPLLILLCLVVAIILQFVWVSWPEINYWYYRTMINYHKRKRLIKLEKKLAALEKPPRAFFFSRINGKYTTVEGPEEDQYLSSNKRKKQKRNKKNKLYVVDKKNKMS